MTTKYRELKNILKQKAVDLHELKHDIKETQINNGSASAAGLQYELYKDKAWYRHRHIAYSMLRGRKYEEIERTCHEDPDWTLIEEVKREYAEAVRACA